MRIAITYYSSHFFFSNHRKFIVFMAAGLQLWIAKQNQRPQSKISAALFRVLYSEKYGKLSTYLIFCKTIVTHASRSFHSKFVSLALTSTKVNVPK